MTLTPDWKDRKFTGIKPVLPKRKTWGDWLGIGFCALPIVAIAVFLVYWSFE